jgi:hypothetical protein
MRNGNPTSLELDPLTSELLDELAERWGISREEAVRRAVEQADARTGSRNKDGRLAAFKELQKRLGLTPAKAAEWQNMIRDARR